jgi:hypothetical protein
MREKRYPRVTTLHGIDAYAMHPLIEVQYSADDAPVRYCGESWCTGACGLPALVIPAGDAAPEMKAYSDMTACGPTMQAWRVTWRGTKAEIPPQHHDAFRKMMWW